MSRREFVPYVCGKRQSSEFWPGRGVLRNPNAGSIPGGPTGVFLLVSEPFPDLLPGDTHCAERTVRPRDSSLYNPSSRETVFGPKPKRS